MLSARDSPRMSCCCAHRPPAWPLSYGTAAVSWAPRGYVSGACSSSCLLQESRGAHAREDFKERDDKHWMKHTVGYYDRPQNKVDISYRRVHDQPLDSEMNHIPPKARTY